MCVYVYVYIDIDIDTIYIYINKKIYIYTNNILYVHISIQKLYKSLTLSAIPVPSCCAGDGHGSISHWYRLGRDTLRSAGPLPCFSGFKDLKSKEFAKTVSFSFFQQVKT